MTGLIQDLRFAIRMLRKAPALTAVALLTLALGIGATSAIFSVVDAVILRPLPYRDAEQLVVIRDNFSRMRLDKIAISPNELIVYQQRSRVIEQMAAFVAGEVNLSGIDAAAQIRAAAVTPSLFPLLGVEAMHGRVFAEGEDEPGSSHVALLGHSLWRARFGGDPAVVGRTLTLDGEPHTIVGVLPAGFDMPHAVEVWVPITFTAEQKAPPSSKGGRFLTALARIKRGATVEDAQRDMDAIAEQLLEVGTPYSRDTGWSISVVPLQEWFAGDTRQALLMLSGAVIFVLLIACANVANLLLARATARRRELAIRAALGAGRGRLAWQLLAESLVLALAGGAAGLLVALWGIDALVAAAPDHVPGLSDVRLDGRALAFTFAVTVVTGLAFGVLPALHATRADPAEVLKEGARGSAGGPGGRLRRALVVAQVSLAFVLLLGAGLMVQSLAKVLGRSPGFDAGGLITAQISLPNLKYPDAPRKVAFFHELLGRARSMPGVRALSAVSLLPLDGRADRGFEIEGDPLPGPVKRNAEIRVVGPSYFQAMGTPLIAGRLLDERDTADAELVVMVNQALARRYFAGRDPIGRRVRMGDEPWRTVVGVIGDVLELGLDQDAPPAMYAPHAQLPSSFMTLVARTSIDPGSFAAQLRKEVRALDADVTTSEPALMEEVVAQSLGPRRLSMWLLGVFAALALFLATVGLYGVTSYAVAQRTQEIAIRMALGARSGRIVGMVVRQTLGLVLAGLVAGTMLVFALSRTLASLIHGVSAWDPLMFLLVVPSLAGAALAASFLPARRAARVDPAAALRAG
jgi:predicted permease